MAEYKAGLRDDPRVKTTVQYPSHWLGEKTGEPWKVCWRAMERADRRGYLDYGIHLDGGWVTDKGKALYADWLADHPDETIRFPEEPVVKPRIEPTRGNLLLLFEVEPLAPLMGDFGLMRDLMEFERRTRSHATVNTASTPAKPRVKQDFYPIDWSKFVMPEDQDD